jgi:hypothetical protein
MSSSFLISAQRECDVAQTCNRLRRTLYTSTILAKPRTMVQQMCMCRRAQNHHAQTPALSRLPSTSRIVCELGARKQQVSRNSATVVSQTLRKCRVTMVSDDRQSLSQMETRRWALVSPQNQLLEEDAELVRHCLSITCHLWSVYKRFSASRESLIERLYAWDCC